MTKAAKVRFPPKPAGTNALHSFMATHATTLVEWESADGKKIKVPPGVRAALQTKYRGQDLGPKALAILDFFNEKPVLKATQRKVDDSSSHDPLQLIRLL